MTEITVLVTGVGGGVGQSVMKGLNLSMQRDGEVEYRVIGVDADPYASGLYRADAGYRVPYAGEEGYVDRLVEIAEKEDVDILIPGSDPEVLEISRNKDWIQEEAGIEVLVSPEESVLIGFDKWRTYEYLSRNGFPTPKTVLPGDVEGLVEEKGFPLVVKPRRGSASRGLFIVTDREDLDHALERSEDVVVQEYLVPENWGDDLDRSDLERQVDEYSTETIVSKEGEVVHSLSNWRKMDKGVPSVAVVGDNPMVRGECEEVVSDLDVVGPVNLQARVTSEGVLFFELNTRFTGSTAVRCVAGFNGPHTMIRNLVLDEEIDRTDLEFESLVEMRYKDEVYIKEERYRDLLEEGRVEGGGEIYDYY